MNWILFSELDFGQNFFTSGLISELWVKLPIYPQTSPDSKVVLFCFAVLVLEPGASHMLGKCSSTELHPQSLIARHLKCHFDANADFLLLR
jgi:hypothetical protein